MIAGHLEDFLKIAGLYRFLMIWKRHVIKLKAGQIVLQKRFQKSKGKTQVKLSARYGEPMSHYHSRKFT